MNMDNNEREQPRGKRVDVGLLREVVVSLRSCGMHYSLANDVEKLHEALVSAQAAHPKPEQAVGDGVVAWYIECKDPDSGIEYRSVTFNQDDVTKLHKPLVSPRPAVATSAEVTDETRLLAEEGLAYFEKAGDAGDKLYVQAIRAALTAQCQASKDNAK